MGARQPLLPICTLRSRNMSRRGASSSVSNVSTLMIKLITGRYALEDAIKPKNKRSIPPRLSGESKTSGRLSALAHPNASDGSGISLVDAQMNGSPKKRLHIDKGISSHETPAQQIRKSPSMSSTKAKDLPDRASSALSMHTRGLIGAWDQAMDADRHTLASSGSIRSKKEHLDEFDALMKSGETMKVSLTPNRLKTFDVSHSRGLS